MQEKYLLPMLERTFEIIKYMSSEEEHSLSEISQDLDIPKTTVFRIITTMKKWGYVEKSKSEDKYKLVEKFKKQGLIVIMMGDGINDAPSLALADVGVAIGAGTQVAIDSANVVLTNSSLSLLLILSNEPEITLTS